MTSLFTLSKSLHESSWLYEQLAFAAAGDAIVLIEDAVLATHSNISLASFSAKCQAADVTLYVLEDDCRLRGIESKYPQIKSIDYTGFVQLVIQHEKQIAW